MAYQFYSWVPWIPAAALTCALENVEAQFPSSYSLCGGFLKGRQHSKFLALSLPDLALYQTFSRMRRLMQSLVFVPG